MTASERKTQATVTTAEDALTALLSVGSELQLQVDLLTRTYGEVVTVDQQPEPAPSGVVGTLTRLADRVETLTREIQRLADEQEQQRTRLGVIGKRGFWFALIVAGAVLLLAGGGFLFAGQLTNRDDLTRLASEQEQLRAEVNCPFYGLIMGSYNPGSRPEGEARTVYEEQFTVMRHIYEDVLMCPGPVVPRPAG